MCVSILNNTGNGCLANSESYQGNKNNTCDGRFAIMSESSGALLTISSSSLVVDGELFSNCGIDASTDKKVVTPENVEWYAYGLYQAVFDQGSDYDYHVDAYQLCGSKMFLNDYSEDCLAVSGEELKCGSIIGAGSNLEISTTKVLNQNDSVETVLFSLNEDVKINAEVVELSGMIYAPNGRVVINAKDFVFSGIIIADSVIINAERVALTACDIGLDISMYELSEADEFTGDLSNAAGSSSSAYYYNNGGAYTDKISNEIYGLNNKVKNGDVVYEDNGFHGLTGHIAMVYAIKTAGKYVYGTGYVAKTYVVVAEAIKAGVCKGVLDDTRFDERAGIVLRKKDANLTSTQFDLIKYFIDKQMGKPYKLKVGRQQTSVDSSNWYCSELVYAAYYFAGIDISPTGIRNLGVGITPRDLVRSQKLKRVVTSVTAAERTGL